MKVTVIAHRTKTTMDQNLNLLLSDTKDPLIELEQVLIIESIEICVNFALVFTDYISIIFIS